MTLSNSYHQPVMVDEALSFLITDRDGNYIDATAGGGYHSYQILSHLGTAGRLLAIDRDSEAVTETTRRLAPFADRATVVQGKFGELKNLASQAGVERVHGILFDLGVSSHQIDRAERGMSYRFDGPLDLRMDPSGGLTAEEVVNGYSAKELANIFFHFGEEKNSRRIAAAIESARRRERIISTLQLAEIIKAATNPRWHSKTLSRVFQSIRIHVNDEISQLEAGLLGAVEVLQRGGRVVAISYHSLEDRLVKNFFREKARTGTGAVKDSAMIRVITKKPVTASQEEVALNPRARSAKMRVAEKN